MQGVLDQCLALLDLGLGRAADVDLGDAAGQLGQTLLQLLTVVVRGGFFDLVVTDYNMPNMDGITMVKEIKKLPNYKFTPIMMLTTESGADKKQQGKAAGATGWIVKPFNPDQLISTVKRVLG